MLQNTVTVAISFIVRVFNKLSFIMNLIDNQIKKMRVFKLTDWQTNLMLQSLEHAKKDALAKFSDTEIVNFMAMYNEVVGTYFPERIKKCSLY